MPLISLNCKRTIVIFVVVIWSGNSFHGPEIFRRNTKNNSCRVTLSLFMDFIISSQFLFSPISSATTLPARGSTTFLKEKRPILSDFIRPSRVGQNYAQYREVVVAKVEVEMHGSNTKAGRHWVWLPLSKRIN